MLTSKTMKIIAQKYANRVDKDNIYPVGLSDSEFVDIIIRELLGEDWYVCDPIGHDQINETALYQILDNYKLGCNILREWRNAMCKYDQ